MGSGIGKVATRVSGSDCWDRNIVGAEPEIFDGVPFISGDVADLEFDEENTLWVVSESEKMIFSFDEEHISCWDEFSTKLVFYHNPVQVLPLSQGRVLVFEAVYPNPFWLYDRGQWSLLPEDQFSLSAKLVVNSSGVVFGGATDGIYRLSSEKWENIVAWNFDEYESCYSIVFDDSDGIWTAVQKPNNTASLLYIKDGKIFPTSYPHNGYVDHRSTVLLAITPDKNLIIGDAEGLHIQTSASTPVKSHSWGEIKNNR